jgi:decaprenyl-phosphate phosphoribosyltransferase
VTVSGPFLILASSGPLFLVVGKRIGERSELGQSATSHRSTLAFYDTGFSAQLLNLALTATVLSYASWAFSTDGGGAGVPWLALSVIPFVTAMLRATQLLVAGRGADPEAAFFRDPGVIGSVAVTAMLVTTSLYLI